MRKTPASKGMKIIIQTNCEQYYWTVPYNLWTYSLGTNHDTQLFVHCLIFLIAAIIISVLENCFNYNNFMSLMILIAAILKQWILYDVTIINNKKVFI